MTGWQDSKNGEGVAQASADRQAVLHFVVRDLRLTVDLCHVLKVLPLVALQPVPGAPNYLKGLMNLGGRSVPVVDLAERLGLTNATPYTPATPVLLCTDGERQAGLVVSDIMGVATVEQHDLQMDSEFTGANSPFLGVVNTERGQSLLLDLGRVLDIELSTAGVEPRADPAVLDGLDAEVRS